MVTSFTAPEWMDIDTPPRPLTWDSRKEMLALCFSFLLSLRGERSERVSLLIRLLLRYPGPIEQDESIAS